MRRLLLLAPVVGCASADLQDARARCDAYVACAGALDPAAGREAEGAYGEGSRCWDHPDRAVGCGQTCTSLLVQGHLEAPDLPACALDGIDLPDLDEAEILWRLEVEAVEGACGPSGFLTGMATVPHPEGFFLIVEDFSGDEPLVFPCVREGEAIACRPARAPTGEEIVPASIEVDADRVRMALTLEVWEAGARCGVWRMAAERR